MKKLSNVSKADQSRDMLYKMLNIIFLLQNFANPLSLTNFTTSRSVFLYEVPNSVPHEASLLKVKLSSGLPLISTLVLNIFVGSPKAFIKQGFNYMQFISQRLGPSVEEASN